MWFKIRVQATDDFPSISYVQHSIVSCSVLKSDKLPRSRTKNSLVEGSSPGGTLNIYWWGCAAAHPKRGVLGTGTTQKRGVLGTGTTQKRGVLGTGTSRKRGVLGTGTSRKRGVLRTGLVKNTILVTDVAQKGVLGAYLLITLTFSCQHDQLVGVYSDRLKNRSLRHGSGQKRGVLGTGQARKKGGLRHGSSQKRGVFTAVRAPPPPPGIQSQLNGALSFDYYFGQEYQVQYCMDLRWC